MTTQLLSKLNLTLGQFWFFSTQLAVLLTWGIRQDLMMRDLNDHVREIVVEVSDIHTATHALDVQVAVLDSRVSTLEVERGLASFYFIPDSLPWSELLHTQPQEPLLGPVTRASN